MIRIFTLITFLFFVGQSQIFSQSCEEVTSRFMSCFKELKKDDLKTPENQKKFKDQEKIMESSTKKTCDKNKAKVVKCYSETLDSCQKFQECIMNQGGK